MSETKILKSSWDCPSFTVLVAKKTLPHRVFKDHLNPLHCKFLPVFQKVKFSQTPFRP